MDMELPLVNEDILGKYYVVNVMYIVLRGFFNPYLANLDKMVDTFSASK
jgi:hypothetical protein